MGGDGSEVIKGIYVYLGETNMFLDSIVPYVAYIFPLVLLRVVYRDVGPTGTTRLCAAELWSADTIESALNCQGYRGGTARLY